MRTSPVRPEPAANPFQPLKDEVVRYAAEMRELHFLPQDEVMAWLSSVSARVLEMILATLDYEGRLSTRFRVETLIPVRDELRYQFQVASRRVSVAQIDFDLARGQTT